MFRLAFVFSSVFGVFCFGGTKTAEILSVQPLATVTEAGSLKNAREEIAFAKVVTTISGAVISIPPQKILIPEDDFTTDEEPEVTAVRKELDRKFCVGDVTGVPQYTVQNDTGNVRVKGVKPHSLPIMANLVRIQYSTGNVTLLYVDCK